MPMPALSAVIVTFNSEAVILSCLTSLHAAASDAEIIIIDNHSTDSTITAIETFTRRHPASGITLVRTRRNCGYARAVNMGLARARGGTIMLLGPDVRLFPNTYQRLRRCLQTDTRIGMAAPRLVDEHGSTRPSVRHLPTFTDLWLELSGLPRLFPGRITASWKARKFDYGTSGPAEQPEASCLLCRREAVRDIGPMDERFFMFFNDVDWCRRFRDEGWSIRYCHDATAVHAGGHSVYQRRLPMIWKSHQGFYRYLKKYTASPGGRLSLILAGFCLITAAFFRSSLWITAKIVKKM